MDPQADESPVFSEPADSPRIPMARPVSPAADPACPAVPAAADVSAGRGPRAQAAVELALLVGVTLLAQVLVVVGMFFYSGRDLRWYFLVSSLVMGLIIMAACLRMSRRAGEPLSAIGWVTQSVAIDALIGVLAMIATMLTIFTIMLTIAVTNEEWIKQQTAAREAIEQTFPPMSFQVVLLMTAWVGIWEETVFRGFLLTRLQTLLRRKWLTLAAGALLFGLAHAYQGLLAMVIITGLGLILGGLFLWRRSLVPCIVFHMLFDLINFQALRWTSTTWQ